MQETPATFEETEAVLRERIAALRAAQDLFSCAKARAGANEATAAMQEYLHKLFSLGEATRDSTELLLAALLYVPITLVGCWVFLWLLFWVARRLTFRRRMRTLLRRLETEHDIVKEEVQRRLICEAPRRANRRELFYVATVKVCLALAAVLALGSLQTLSRIAVRQVAVAWWHNLIHGSEGSSGALLPRVVAAGKAAVASVRWGGGTDVRPSSASEDAAGSAARPRREARDSWWGLVGGGAQSLQSLYLSYLVGSTLLGFAIHLLKSATDSMKTVIREVTATVGNGNGDGAQPRSGALSSHLLQRMAKEEADFELTQRLLMVTREALALQEQGSPRDRVKAPSSSPKRLAASNPDDTPDTTGAPHPSASEVGAEAEDVSSSS